MDRSQSGTGTAVAHPEPPVKPRQKRLASDRLPFVPVHVVNDAEEPRAPQNRLRRSDSFFDQAEPFLLNQLQKHCRSCCWHDCWPMKVALLVLPGGSFDRKMLVSGAAVEKLLGIGLVEEIQSALRIRKFQRRAVL